MPDALHLLLRPVARDIDGLGLRLDRALGVHPDDDAVRALLFHLSADAARSAAGAGSHHDHVHLAVALLEDLLRGGVVVRQRVAGVPVL